MQFVGGHLVESEVKGRDEVIVLMRDEGVETLVVFRLYFYPVGVHKLTLFDTPAVVCDN